MKLLLNNRWFWLFLGLFIIHQIMAKGLGIRVSFLDNYLDDLLCLPLLLSGWLAERNVLFGKPRMEVSEMIILWLLVSLLFELLLPKFYPQYTSDIWDVVCYGIGGLLFFLLINPKLAEPVPYRNI